MYFSRKNEQIIDVMSSLMGGSSGAVSRRPVHAPGNRTPHYFNFPLLSLIFINLNGIEL